MSPLLAQSGHTELHRTCPLSGVKRAAMNLFQLSFGEWLQLLFGFSGRINRAKYWLTLIIYFVALFALYVLFSLDGGQADCR